MSLRVFRPESVADGGFHNGQSPTPPFLAAGCVRRGRVIVTSVRPPGERTPRPRFWRQFHGREASTHAMRSKECGVSAKTAGAPNIPPVPRRGHSR